MSTMSSAVCALALLCFIPMSRSAPLGCEDLVRPLDQFSSQYFDVGWALVAGSLRELSYVERFKQRSSAKIKFSNSSESSEILLSRIFGFGDKCESFPSNITLEGSSFTTKNITVTFISTSRPDSLLMRFDDSQGVRNIYLFSSKKREMEENETEEFKKQAECLNLLPPVVMDPTKDLCPDEPSTVTPAPAEEEAEAQKA